MNIKNSYKDECSLCFQKCVVSIFLLANELIKSLL